MSAADIAANNRAFESAVERGDVGAIGALLAPDVVTLPPDGPIVRGSAAVEQLWASAINDHGIKSCRIITDELDILGDMASEVGHVAMTMAAPGGKSVMEKIKYVVVWKRVGGKWLLHRDIWNAATD